MKNRLLVLLIALCVFLLTACSQPVQSGGAVSTDAAPKAARVADITVTPITAEYLLANTELTEEDLDGIDFDGFLEFCGASYAEQITDTLNLIPSNLRYYKEQLEEERLYGPKLDFSVIWRQAEGTLTDEDLDDIEVVICNDYDGNLSQTVVIDFTTGKVYSGYSDFYKECDDRYLTSKVTQYGRDWLIDALSSRGITSWKTSYEGSNAGTTGHAGMSVAFRLADGRCISYSSNGVHSSSRPVDMILLCRDIIAVFHAD